jgi:hypothetical protein
MAKETDAAGPAWPAAMPGKTKIPAPIIVPTPMARPPVRPSVRSSSTPVDSSTVASSSTVGVGGSGRSPSLLTPPTSGVSVAMSPGGTPALI